MNKKQSRRKSPKNKKQSRRKSRANKKHSRIRSPKNKKQSVRIHRRIKNDGGSPPFLMTTKAKRYNLNHIDDPLDPEYYVHTRENILVPKDIKVLLIKKYPHSNLWIGKVTFEAYRERFPNFPDGYWDFGIFLFDTENKHVYITNFDIEDY